MVSNKIVVAALKQLESRAGRITAKGLVEASKDPAHPLHSKFMWGDDAKAAQEHRLDIARGIINSVRVELRVGTHVVSTIGYVRDPDAAPQQGYIAVNKIQSDKDTARTVMIAEVDRIKASLVRARTLAESLGLEDELQDSLDALQVLRDVLAGKQPPASGGLSPSH